MKQILSLLAFAPAALWAQQKTFTINGQLKNVKDPVQKVYLLHMLNGKLSVDSAAVTNGKYQLKGEADRLGQALLLVNTPDQRSIKSRGRESASIFLEPASFEITHVDSFSNTSTSGSLANAEYKKLQAAQKPYNDQLNEWYPKYVAAAKAQQLDEAKKWEKKLDSLDEVSKEAVYLPYLKNNPSSPLALYALNIYSGYDIDPQKIEPLFNALPAATKASSDGEAFKKRLDAAKKTAIGSIALDFTQNDTLGKPVTLSSFRGKYVLVDFWASWCGPCRRENPNVVKAFNRFKDKGFHIIGVSLDQPGAQQDWLNAIHKDGLTWTHVSDLQYWNNAVAKEYGIQAIPQNFLIDPDGKIIGKSLRGEDLEQKLEEVYKN